MVASSVPASQSIFTYSKVSSMDVFVPVMFTVVPSTVICAIFTIKTLPSSFVYEKISPAFRDVTVSSAFSIR